MNECGKMNWIFTSDMLGSYRRPPGAVIPIKSVKTNRKAHSIKVPYRPLFSDGRLLELNADQIDDMPVCTDDWPPVLENQPNTNDQCSGCCGWLSRYSEFSVMP